MIVAQSLMRLLGFSHLTFVGGREIYFQAVGVYFLPRGWQVPLALGERS